MRKRNCFLGAFYDLCMELSALRTVHNALRIGHTLLQYSTRVILRLNLDQITFEVDAY